MTEHPDRMPDLPPMAPSLTEVTASLTQCLEPTADACVRYLKTLEAGGLDASLTHHMVFLYQQVLLNQLTSVMGEARHRELAGGPQLGFNPLHGFIAMLGGPPPGPGESKDEDTGGPVAEEEPPLGELSEIEDGEGLPPVPPMNPDDLGEDLP